MSVLIKGIEMPKEGSWRTVRIYPDGTCAVPNWQGDCTYMQGCEAVPVPPHGRLIDADAFEEELEKVWNATEDYEFANHDSWKTLHAAPIIIPAEEDINVLGKEEGET